MVICPLGVHLDDISSKGKVNFNMFSRSMCYPFNVDQHMRYAKPFLNCVLHVAFESLGRLLLFLAVILLVYFPCKATEFHERKDIEHRSLTVAKVVPAGFGQRSILLR